MRKEDKKEYTANSQNIMEEILYNIYFALPTACAI